jgi:hypothetical protein
MEQPAPFQIKLAVDEIGAFDYEKCKSDRFSMDEYKRILANEINIIK